MICFQLDSELLGGREHCWHVFAWLVDYIAPGGLYGRDLILRGMLVTQSCPILCDPMDYSLPGSSVHGIVSAAILEWVAISSSRGSSQPGD